MAGIRCLTEKLPSKLCGNVGYPVKFATVSIKFIGKKRDALNIHTCGLGNLIY